MTDSRKALALLFAAFAAAPTAACNVSATSHSTGPVNGLPENSVATDGGAACDRGVSAVLSDFTSTQIALLSTDGTPLSPSFLSTASTTTSGLAFPVSGDVVLPSARPASGRVVLLDRFGTNVLTWADPGTARVLAQLPVGTGFESNPQDYLELDETRAYVTRWGVNDAPNMQPFDSGSDVLVIDPRAPAPSITKSIPMPSEDGLPPRPSGMLQIGSTTIVVLQRTSEDFATVGEARLVGLQSDAVAWQARVTGLQNCGRPSLSPSGATMALACEGQLDAMGDVLDPTTAAIVLYDVRTLPPTETKRLTVSADLGSSNQDTVAWVSEGVLFGTTQTPQMGATNNQAFVLDVATGHAKSLLMAGTDAQGMGKGIVYGGVRCSPGCADVCLLADADTGKVRRWHIGADAQLTALPDVDVDPTVGLPPQSFGSY